jgi:membrane peptidoglycan carboxypeptidase
MGATPDYAAAVQVFNDSTSPKGICIGSGPPRLCSEGNIYGGTVPAATWFDTMVKVHADLPEKPLPQVEERYVHGDPELTVPDVVGSEISKASAMLRDAGYQVTTVSISSPKPRGAVIAQSLRGLSLRGVSVTLSVSSGPVLPPTTTSPPEPLSPAAVLPPPAPGVPSAPHPG